MNEKLTKNNYKKKYLKGLFSIKVDFNEYKVIYRLLGIKFASANFYCGYMKFKIFGFIKISTKLFTKQLLLPILYKYVKENITEQKSDIILLLNRSGETFLFSFYIQNYIIQNSINRPVFISPFAYLGEIINMTDFKNCFLKIPNVFMELHFFNINNISYKNVKYYEILNHSHFVELEKAVQNGQKRYFYNEILNRLNQTKNNAKELLLEKSKIDSAKIKFSKLNIRNKYIYIAPAAKSNSSHSIEFWQKLELQLFNLGYDIIWNTLPEGHDNSYNKYCNFTLQEAAYIASLADYVIGVRSGLLDILSYFNSNIFCTYFPFFNRGKDLPKMSADKVIETFTLKNLPFVNPDKIVEFNGEELDENEILEQIIKIIKNKNGIEINEVFNRKI